VTTKRCAICDITNSPALSINHVRSTYFDNPKAYAYWIHSLMFFKRKGLTVCSYCENMHKHTLKELTYEQEV